MFDVSSYLSSSLICVEGDDFNGIARGPKDSIGKTKSTFRCISLRMLLIMRW